MQPTFPSSPDMSVKKLRDKYPWRTMNVGESFAIYYTDMTYKSAVNYSYRMSRKLNRTFRVKNHAEKGCSEVARLADPGSEPAKPAPDFGFDK